MGASPQLARNPGAGRAAGSRAGAAARRLALAAAAALAGLVAACGIHIGSFDLRFGSIEESLDSGIRVASTAVARSPGEWARLWLAHDARFAPPRPLPFVDFNRDIVVAVFLGQRQDRCSWVRIERVLMLDDSRIIVRYREMVRPPFPTVGGSCGFGQSAPAAIVRIPAFDLPVRFEQLGTLFTE